MTDRCVPRPKEEAVPRKKNAAPVPVPRLRPERLMSWTYPPNQGRFVAVLTIKEAGKVDHYTVFRLPETDTAPHILRYHFRKIGAPADQEGYIVRVALCTTSKGDRV